MNRQGAKCAKEGELNVAVSIQEIHMEVIGFDLAKPKEVCDYGGLDEQYTESHFKGRDRNEIDYSNESLLEDLMWMNHAAFKYYLPGFLIESLNDDYGDLAGRTLSAIESHISGPRAKRIRFSQEQAQTLDCWFDLILDQFAEDSAWGFVPRIAKYRGRVWPEDPEA
ncbi:MAG: hypothetical protein AAF711_09395 [Planctomycetota bacterium]